MGRGQSLSIIYEYLQYLHRKNKVGLALFSILSIVLTSLEIFAVWFSVKIIEITSAIAKGSEVPLVNFPILQNKLQSIQLSTQLAILAAITFSLFLFRSVAQVLVNKRILLSLSRTAARISIEGMKNTMERNTYLGDYKKLSQIEYLLTVGLDKAILTMIGSAAILVSDIFLIFFTILFLVVYDLATAITLFTFGIFSFLLVNKLATSKLKNIGREKVTLDITLSSQIKDTISIAVEARNTKIFSSLIDEIKNKRFKQGELYSLQTIFPYISKYVIELGFLLFATMLSSYKLIIGTIVDAASALGLLFLGGSRLTPALLRIQQSLQAIAGATGPAEEALSELKSAELLAKAILKHNLTSSPHISLRNIEFGWTKENLVFGNLNLDIYANKLNCIVGRTGVGKTTLARLLMGDLKPNFGAIEYCLDASSKGSNVKEPIYVPQDPHLMNSNLETNLFLTIEDLIIIKYELRQILEDLDLKALLEVLDNELNSIELNNKKQTTSIFLSSLSGGERQRLGIARALLQDSYMYLFDEPTSSLDKNTSEKAIKLLKLRSVKATVICITHDENLIRAADNLIDLNN
jgi:ABC-type transport system involved in cytochrome bd biosynthesis fused ATPase/permease subunit